MRSLRCRRTPIGRWCQNGPVRRLLILACAVVFLDVTFFSILTPLLPSYQSDHDLSDGAAGILAGSFAAGGEPAAEHTITCLGERGIDAQRHRSQHIDDFELALFDPFYCMTGSHAAALVERGVPTDRIFAVDPNGVPDPYGGPLSAYETCAATMDYAITGMLDGI